VQEEDAILQSVNIVRPERKATYYRHASWWFSSVVAANTWKAVGLSRVKLRKCRCRTGTSEEYPL
jgi:hypothetical protein